jgi:outer membrane assembly lipoprotein YfiO
MTRAFGRVEEPGLPVLGTFAVMLRRLVLFTLVLAACHSETISDQYPDPASLFDAAMTAFRQGDYSRARTAFQNLTVELSPRDDRQPEARYYLAECMMRSGDELEAAGQFRRVADDFPTHRLAADALLRAGDAYAAMWRNPALDPTYGETALATYRELLSRYPGTPAAQRANLRVQQLNERLADKDYRNGVFYLRLRAYDSAIIYFKDVVGDLPAARLRRRAQHDVCVPPPVLSRYPGRSRRVWCHWRGGGVRDRMTMVSGAPQPTGWLLHASASSGIGSVAGIGSP